MNFKHSQGNETSVARLPVDIMRKVIDFLSGPTPSRSLNHLWMSCRDLWYGQLKKEFGYFKLNISMSKKYINDISRSCFQNSGQICLCSSRVFVHKDIFDEFIQELTKYARSIKLGDPLSSDTKMGPAVSKQHYDKIKSYIELNPKFKSKVK